YTNAVVLDGSRTHDLVVPVRVDVGYIGIDPTPAVTLHGVEDELIIGEPVGVEFRNDLHELLGVSHFENVIGHLHPVVSVVGNLGWLVQPAGLGFYKDDAVRRSDTINGRS